MPTISFAFVDPADATSAYHWHRGFAGASGHIYPRSHGQFHSFCQNGHVLCARDHSNDFLAMGYYCDEKSDEAVHWEIGGLMASVPERGKGLAGALSRFRVGHLLVEHDPLSRGERIITHVLKGNSDPLRLIVDKLKFKHVGPVTVPMALLPGLPHQNGFVHGDEYELATPDTLLALATYFEGWTGTLADGRSVDLPFRDSPAQWAEAIRDMATR